MVGDSKHSATLSSTIPFFTMRNFSTSPIVLATAYGQDYVDTFAVVTSNVGQKDFSTQAYRVDQKEWTQGHFAINYWAFDPTSLPAGVQAASIEVGASPSAMCKTMPLKFPNVRTRAMDG